MYTTFEPCVENVSRRAIIRGLGITAGLVLAAPILSRRSMAAYSMKQLIKWLNMRLVLPKWKLFEN